MTTSLFRNVGQHLAVVLIPITILVPAKLEAQQNAATSGASLMKDNSVKAAVDRARAIESQTL